jgi:hypothetical protein
MYTAVNGIYENGRLRLTESPPTTKKSKVVVMFLEKLENHRKHQVGVKIGSLANMRYKLPDDFNEQLY